MKHTHRPIALCLLAGASSLLLPLHTAWAQTQDPNALAGPTVKETPKPGTIIQHDFQGSITRLQIPPDEAAAAKLTLNETQQAALNKILTERAALIDTAVANNYELLLKLQGFRQMTPIEQREHLGAWREALAPLRERGRLQDELAGVLEPAQKAELRRMVNEYWNALVEEETMKSASRDALIIDVSLMDEPTAKEEEDDESGQRNGRRAGGGNGGNGGRGARGGIIMRESLAIMGHQLKASFDRRVSSSNANLEDLLQNIDATPEQREKLKAISLEYAQKTLNKPTDTQRIELFEAISRELTPKQRRELIKIYTQKPPAPQPK